MVKSKLIWTIGHSNRTIEVFIALLQSFNIQLLADVRNFPGSKKFPHFNKDALRVSLEEAGISYVHFKALGGRRKPLTNSKNSGWRLAAFRGYADYMETEDFKKAVNHLEENALNKGTALMCSEAVWWSCHRSLIADYLKVRGWDVEHIMAAGKALTHPFTSPARVVEGELNYEKDS
jgi:uncharacterized protein (DUF488 family)